jgi:transposase
LLQSRVGEVAVKKHYSALQRLRILWHLEYFGIPRSRVKERFGVSVSTLYRWLHAAEKGKLLNITPLY